MPAERSDGVRFVRLKNVTRINERSLAETTDPDLEFRYVDMGGVGRGGLTIEPRRMTFADAPSRARRLVRSGDTIVSTVRTYLRAVWPINQPATDLVVSTGFAVLTPKPQLDSRYLGWLAQSDVLVEEIVARSVGVSYPAISPLDIGELRVPLIPLRDQWRLAEYLDVETHRIDSLIAKKRRMIQLIETRFGTFVDVTVDAGSEVEARRLTSLITSGPRGWSEVAGESGLPFIRSANLRYNSLALHISNLEYVNVVPSAEAHRSQVREGDVLIGITGANAGWIAIVSEDLALGYVSQHVAIMRPSNVLSEWLAFSFFGRRVQEQLLAGQYGGTKLQLGLQELGGTRVFVPSLLEQRAFVARMKEADVHRQALTTRLAKQIDLLEERRQVVITSAVTGQLEIPGVVAA